MASILNATTSTGLVTSADNSGSLQLATNNGTTAVTIDTSQNVGIGTASPSYKVHASSTGASCAVAIQAPSTYSASVAYITPNRSYFTGVDIAGVNSSWTLYDGTTGAERLRVDSSGNLLVNATSSSSFGNAHRITKSGGQGQFLLSVDGGTDYSALFIAVSGGNYNTADCAIRVGRNSSNSRSINAGGTVNSNGADYAEYMIKAGSFEIAKGDICGIDVNGKLTNVFDDAITFVVKSTDPSFVGGDVWGNEQALGKNPSEDATQEELDLYQEKLESARQTVDRIAFAGQVPVNVMGAIAGQYIIPVNDNGSIKGEAVSNPTFEQYQLAVGKVIAIESDGRAKIIVKVV
jgi:hypothetical protein